MKILFSPQVPANYTDKIIYKFDEEIITVTDPSGAVDSFDFSNFPDGRLSERGIETVLNPNPIVDAWREDGELHVELLNYIGLEATEAERFPDWIDHTEYNPPKVSDENG